VTGTIRLGGTDVPYIVRESRRASQPSLRIRDGSAVEVVLPLRARGAGVELLLRRHARWILRTLDRLRRETGGGFLESGSRLALNGIDRMVRIEREDRRRSSVHVSEEEIVIRLPRVGHDDVRPILQRHLIRMAAQWIPQRLQQLNAPWQLPVSGVTIRNQRTRWGSCSRRGRISLNWRLVILPPFVADYLIFHELAHIKHLNHSQAYWRFVQRLCPDFREAERWLRRHGRSVLL